MKFYISELVYNHLQKILEKLGKLRESRNHKRNIIIYNEKLHYNCDQQLPTLSPRKLGNSGGKK